MRKIIEYEMEKRSKKIIYHSEYNGDLLVE